MIEREARPRRSFNFDAEPVEDASLSWQARGVLLYLLSKPDHWRTDRGHLTTQAPNGMTSVRSILTELEAAGYLTRERTRGNGGRWSWKHVIHECAVPKEQRTTGGKPANGATSENAGQTTGRITAGGGAAAIGSKEDLEIENKPLPPTAVPPDGGPAPENGEVALRNGRATQAANGTLARLKAEVEAGRRSWSLSEAATAEWLALLDDDHGLRAAQEFVMFYLGLNTGRANFEPAHWSMCGLRVRRWRGLVLHGVDEAITRVDPDEQDGRGRIGQPFWAYVEKVCQETHARNQEASP